MKISTKCVQSGYQSKNGEARIMPIVQSTTFQYDTPEEMADLFDLKKSGYFYTRLGNPTLGGFEDKMTALEGGVGAMATASGMSATMISILNLVKAGENFLSSSEIYGGTFNLFEHTFKKMGIECRFFRPEATAAEIEALIDDKTKAIFCETIANPAGTVFDFEKVVKIAEKYGICTVCDNTIATPFICRPIEFGINVVMHASTKYLDGHATSVGGIIVDGGNFEFKGNPRYPDYNQPDVSYHGLVFADTGAGCYILRARTVFMRDLGAQMAPMNAFLTNLGVETLHLRMKAHSENALKVAEMLEGNDAVEWVSYPGLKNDKNHTLAEKYFDGGLASGMVTFGIKGGVDEAIKFQKALKLIKIVTHIADARSCVLHPASTTHRQLSEEALKSCGISKNLIRLSIGIEDADDIVEDVKNALAASQK